MRPAFPGQVCTRHVPCSPRCPPEEETGELLKHKLEGKKKNQPGLKNKTKQKKSSTEAPFFSLEGSYLLSLIRAQTGSGPKQLNLNKGRIFS